MHKKLGTLFICIVSLAFFACEEEDLSLKRQFEREQDIFVDVMRNRDIDADTYKTTESGIFYYYQQTNPLGVTTPSGRLAEIAYKGTYLYGPTFDQDTLQVYPSTGDLFQFQDTCGIFNGRVIQGWVEILSILKTGEKATFLLPSSLAYGTSGNQSIPANTPLEFQMELVNTIDTTGLICTQ